MTMKNFKCGLCSVSFRENSSEEILRAMTAAGLKYIEWGSDIHAPPHNTENLTTIAELQEKYGIVCSSYGTYFRIGSTPQSELTEYIRAARILGTDVLRLWCGVKGSASLTPAEREELISCSKDCARLAESEGVVLAMECHTGTYTDTTESILDLMSAVDSPAFRMYWQPNQFRTDVENLVQAKAVAPYTVNIHAFNWVGNDKFPLADATKLWQDYLACFCGDETVLLEFMPDGRIESLAAEADALRKIKGAVL